KVGGTGRDVADDGRIPGGQGQGEGGGVVYAGRLHVAGGPVQVAERTLDHRGELWRDEDAGEYRRRPLQVFPGGFRPAVLPGDLAKRVEHAGDRLGGPQAVGPVQAPGN